MGTADDASLVPELATAKTELGIARAAGLRAVRLTVIWSPGQTEPSRDDVGQVRPWGGWTDCAPHPGAIAACQPRVEMLLIFHVRDEPNLAGWPSGLYYLDDRPKASLPLVSRAIEAVENDSHGTCTRRHQEPRLVLGVAPRRLRHGRLPG